MEFSQEVKNATDSIYQKISKTINTYDFNWDNIPFEDTFNIHNYQKPLNPQ